MKTKISRIHWAYLLVFANALSMVMMYSMQGVLVAAESIESLPSWFWYADIAGWALRSFVESLVVFYLFRTQANNWFHKILLSLLELGLITLIALTQGPALYAFTMQLPIRETLDSDMLRLWTYGLGAYGALMLAGAGVAYRIQPDDVETINFVKHEQEVNVLKDRLEITDRQIAELKLEQLKSENVQEWIDLIKSMKSGQLARALGKTVPEVNQMLSEMQGEQDVKQ